jgi:hypothetical protein
VVVNILLQGITPFADKGNGYYEEPKGLPLLAQPGRQALIAPDPRLCAPVSLQVCMSRERPLFFRLSD